jgi:hypothetical protein
MKQFFTMLWVGLTLKVFAKATKVLKIGLRERAICLRHRLGI